MSLFPKFYGPLAIWPWLWISPHSSLNICSLIITAWQWLMSFTNSPCIPMQIKPNKSPVRNRLKALFLWDIGYLSFPSRSCLGSLILICGGWGCSAGRAPPNRLSNKIDFSNIHNILFLFLPILFSSKVLPLWWFQQPIKKLLSKMLPEEILKFLLMFYKQWFNVIPLITHMKSRKKYTLESAGLFVLMNFSLPNNCTYNAKTVTDEFMLRYWDHNQFNKTKLY